MTQLEVAHKRAVGEVDRWVLETHESSSRASRWQLQQHGYEADHVGWVIPIPNDVSVLVAVDRLFPYSLPSTAVFGKGAPSQGPHVEANGRLCTFGDKARTDSTDCIGVVRAYVTQSIKLLSEIGDGQHTGDFVVDFNAYWSRGLRGPLSVWTLLDWLRAPRSVVACFGSKQFIIADDEVRLRTWLQNQSKDLSDLKVEPALYLWLKQLPVPAQYPATSTSLRRLVREQCPDALTVYDGLFAAKFEKRVIVFAGPSSPGEIGRGAFIVRSTQGQEGAPQIKGFRPGRAPAHILQLANDVARTKVIPLDAASTRMPGDAYARLRGSRVAILGCGSLGSGVARLLVKSGCLDIKLFDPEAVGFENIGRHELGAAEVGSNKATTLAAQLRRQLPECQAQGFDCDWRDVMAADDHVLADRHVIISTTGEWGSDSALADLGEAGILTCPVVFGWMERHATAAHALVFNGDLGTFRRGFDATGGPLRAVTSWWREEHSPGCGGATSAYGAVELGRAQSLVAGLVLDLLMEAARPPLWRVEVSPTPILEGLGGYWSKWFCDTVGDPGLGGRSFALEW